LSWASRLAKITLASGVLLINRNTNSRPMAA
jgi:hypothetical protein